MISVIRSAVILLSACSLLAAQTANPQQLFQEAVAAQQRGDDAVAMRKYREILQMHPEATVARANLGATLAHLKQFDQAIEQYRLVLASDPTNQQIRMNLALAYHEMGDFRSAVGQLEPLHKSETTDAQTSLLLADCYFQLERYASVVSLLSPMEATQPDNLDLDWLLGSALIHTGRAQDGVERIEKVADKAANADAFLLAGQTRLDLNQYDLAQRDTDAAIRLNPTLAGVQTLKGMVLEHTGDYDGAEAALRQALKLDANDFDAHFYLGAILYFKRDMDGSRLHLERALQLRPASAQARYKLALVARTDGHPDEALRNLLKVTIQSPGWLEPHIELSALYFRLHRPEDGAKERLVVDRLLAAPQRVSEPTP